MCQVDLEINLHISCGYFQLPGKVSYLLMCDFVLQTIYDCESHKMSDQLNNKTTMLVNSILTYLGVTLSPFLSTLPVQTVWAILLSSHFEVKNWLFFHDVG